MRPNVSAGCGFTSDQLDGDIMEVIPCQKEFGGMTRGVGKDRE